MTQQSIFAKVEGLEGGSVTPIPRVVEVQL
jgi:hypothetical protein